MKKKTKGNPRITSFIRFYRNFHKPLSMHTIMVMNKKVILLHFVPKLSRRSNKEILMIIIKICTYASNTNLVSYLLKLAPINYILNKLPVHGNGFNMNMFNMFVCPSVCLFYVVPLRGNYIFI